MTQPNDESKPYTTRPTTQVDLEARLNADQAKQELDPNVTVEPYKVEGNDTSAYVGVDQDKMNYANDTEMPLKGDGVEDEVAELMMSGYAYGKVAPDSTPGQDLGSGSSQPLLAVTSSGSDVQHEIKTPAPDTESKPPVTGASNTSQKNSDDEAPASPRKAPAPKPPTASDDK